MDEQLQRAVEHDSQLHLARSRISGGAMFPYSHKENGMRQFLALSRAHQHFVR